MIKILMPIDSRVDSGVRLLDRYGPDCWRDLVDADALNIDLSDACVVGQLFDDWEVGQGELELRGVDDAIFYGFFADQPSEGELLTESWRSVLRGTRSPGTQPWVESEDELLSWQCGWQSAYGLPGARFCVAPRGQGDRYCPEHDRDFAETYPHLACG